MKNILRLLGPLALLCAGAQAATLDPPSGVITIGGSTTPFTLFNVPGSKLYDLNVDIRNANWAVTGNATVNQDPWIDYGFSLKNFGVAPIDFTILLQTPFVGGPYTLLKSSHSGSATDSGGGQAPNGTVLVAASHQPYVDGVPYGGITGGCSVSGTPGNSYGCGLGNQNSIAIATGATGNLSLVLSGTLSAGDVYTFNGLASIQNLQNEGSVPEPATAGLAVLAFGAAALIRRRLAA